MASITYKQKETKNHYIYMECKSGLWFVGACTRNDSLADYPFWQTVYLHDERDKALRTFNRYVKKCIEMEE